VKVKDAVPSIRTGTHEAPHHPLPDFVDDAAALSVRPPDPGTPQTEISWASIISTLVVVSTMIGVAALDDSGLYTAHP